MLLIVFPIYHLITRKEGITFRQGICIVPFIGVAPTHLTREPVDRSIIILYIVIAQSALTAYQSKVSSLGRIYVMAQ